MSSFQKVDTALGRYYASLGRSDYFQDGTGKFLSFCEANGFEEEDIEDELDDMENCLYLDFDVYFPFNKEYETKSEHKKQEFMFNLLKQCYENPDTPFKHDDYGKEEVKHSYTPFKYDDVKEKPKGPIQNPIIKGMCDALGRYYKSVNKEYHCIFSEFCDDNGLGDDSVVEELTQPAADCLLADFDDNFPFNDNLKKEKEEERKGFIFGLIKMCHQDPDIQFDPNVPQSFYHNATLKHLYKITQDEWQNVLQIYEKQCPVLWSSGMAEDKGFLYAVAIGKKYGFEYLQYLMDGYNRDRVIDIDKHIVKKQWCMQHPHFNALKGIKYKKPWNDDSKNEKDAKICDARDLAIAAMESFDKRCVPVLDLTKIFAINDSIEIAARYMETAFGFVRHLFNNARSRGKPICPFQIDVCIAYGKTLKVDKKVGLHDDDNQYDDDDDDDDVENESKDDVDVDKIYVNIVGDVKGKLDKNNLRYVLGRTVPANESDQEYLSATRDFAKSYKEYLRKHKLEIDRGKEAPQMYLHNKRFVVLVDRRPHNVAKKNCEEIWMYEPPENCRNIPKDPVPEWYINASNTCLLPNMDYGDGKSAEMQSKHIGLTDLEELRNSNIHSSFHCKGEMLTLSIIAKTSDQIKSYLYWRGGMTRFMPQDVKAVLPAIFSTKWNGQQKLRPNEKSLNEKFVEGDVYEEFDDINALIQRMQNNMKDVYFNTQRNLMSAKT